MKIVLAGGSGQVGRMLARAFRTSGDEVVVLGRPPGTPQDSVRFVPWDGRTLGSWAAELEDCDWVFGLAGRSVNCRYTAVHRREITESRVHAVRVLGQAIAACARPPRLWLQASTATIYRHTLGPANDEKNGVLGGNEPDVPDTWRFSIEVATAWEQAVREVGTLPQTRVVLLRSAMTMSPDRGGVFDALLRLVRLGLGGAAGNGRQYVSWIHETDFIRAMRWIGDNETLRGPINIAAPHPLPNAEFMKSLRDAWGMRIGLPAAGLMLEAGAALFRTETELILKSRRVVPGLLLEGGFVFRHPTWPEAARDLCHRWKRGESGSDGTKKR